MILNSAMKKMYMSGTKKRVNVLQMKYKCILDKTNKSTFS